MDAPPSAYVAAASDFSTDEHVASPKPPNSSWTGIMIAAPVEGKAPSAIVHGTFRIKAVNYPTKARWKLVLIDSGQQQLEAEMGQRDPNPVDPDPEADRPVDEKTKAAMTYVGHFNADIFQTFPVPPKPGSYRVFATLGSLRSNEISIKLVAP